LDRNRNGHHFLRDIRALPDGSAVVTGGFFGTLILGPGEETETTLTSGGRGDIFVAKYSQDGQLDWAASLGGVGRDSSNSIEPLSNGSLLITGQYDSVDDNTFDSDVFAAKISPDGDTDFLSTASGNGFSTGMDLSPLGDGSFLLTGGINGVVVFGPDEPNETVLISGFSNPFGAIFVAKYNADGIVEWAKQTIGTSTAYGASISANADGSCFVTGTFLGTVRFGSGETSEMMLQSAVSSSWGATDVFLVKYGPDGSLIWATKAGGSGRESGNAVVALPDGSCLVSGDLAYDTSSTFGEGETNVTVLSGGGSFVAKYNSAGTLAWAKKAGSSGWVDETSLNTDGSYVLTGGFWQKITFGLGEENETVLNARGNDDMFIAKYDSEGTLIWVKQEGSDFVWDFSTPPPICFLIPTLTIASKGTETHTSSLRSFREEALNSTALNVLTRAYYRFGVGGK
ncbi:hypothetical protein ACFL1X_14680, partial [Candidatus Hydrogenedentota bacterium]